MLTFFAKGLCLDCPSYFDFILIFFNLQGNYVYYLDKFCLNETFLIKKETNDLEIVNLPLMPYASSFFSPNANMISASQTISPSTVAVAFPFPSAPLERMISTSRRN